MGYYQITHEGQYTAPGGSTLDSEEIGKKLEWLLETGKLVIERTIQGHKNLYSLLYNNLKKVSIMTDIVIKACRKMSDGK